MKKTQKIRLAVIGLMLVLACQYPLVSFFNTDKLILGIPGLLLYLMLVWGVVSVVIIYMTLKLDVKRDRHNE